jgi:hypothetical protein
MPERLAQMTAWNPFSKFVFRAVCARSAGNVGSTKDLLQPRSEKTGRS